MTETTPADVMAAAIKRLESGTWIRNFEGRVSGDGDDALSAINRAAWHMKVEGREGPIQSSIVATRALYQHVGMPLPEWNKSAEGKAQVISTMREVEEQLRRNHK